jgi:hypothetical protein
MPQKPGPSALRPALYRWVQQTLAGIPAFAPRVFSDEGNPSIDILSDGAEAAVIEIGRHLGVLGQHFRGPTPLIQFLSDSLADVALRSGPPFDAEGITTTLLERLASPLQPFRFRAPLFQRSELSVSIPIGGLNELSLESAGDSQTSIAMSGVVHAPTEPAAIFAIEDIAETILGISIALDLCVIMAPLPGTSPNFSLLEIAPHDPGIPVQLRSDVAAGIAGTVFRVPASLSQLERHQMKAGDFDGGFQRHLRSLEHVMTATDDRAVELQRAGSLLLRASVAGDVGLAMTYGFMSLEGLLLERSSTDNVQARLAEAVAYRLGTSKAERVELRKEVRELYDIRSKYVHTGQAGLEGWKRADKRCFGIVARVLQLEIEEAPS